MFSVVLCPLSNAVEAFKKVSKTRVQYIQKHTEPLGRWTSSFYYPLLTGGSFIFNIFSVVLAALKKEKSALFQWEIRNNCTWLQLMISLQTRQSKGGNSELFKVSFLETVNGTAPPMSCSHCIQQGEGKAILCPSTNWLSLLISAFGNHTDLPSSCYEPSVADA